jgi:hypothetical protein
VAVEVAEISKAHNQVLLVMVVAQEVQVVVEMAVTELQIPEVVVVVVVITMVLLVVTVVQAL